jgi:hypothetical protein
MKIFCKVRHLATLTYLKSYDVIIQDDSGYTIIDDFYNKQRYYHEYFMSLGEGRDLIIDNVLDEGSQRKDIEN